MKQPRNGIACAFALIAAAPLAAAPAVSVETALDRSVPELLRRYSVPGAAVAVIRKQRIVALRGYGLADIAAGTTVTADTLFNVGSMSKTLTAWGLMQLVERGKLDLDKPVSLYVRRWRLPSGNFDSSGVTFARVLSHTAGISTHGYNGVDAAQPRAAVLDILEGKTGAGVPSIASAPGSGFLYSGANYLLVQMAIEDVTGEAFQEFMAREVFRPLGMRNSTFELPIDDPAFARAYDGFANPLPRLRYDALSAAGLTTTLHDVARFAVAAFPTRNGRGDLSRATVEKMQTAAPKSVWAERDPLGPSPAYGLGFTVRPDQFKGHPGIGHGGSNSGWESLFQIVPDTGDGIVILTNSANGTALIAGVLCEWRRSANATASCPAVDARIPLLAKYRADGVDAMLALYDDLRSTPDRYDLSVSQLNSLGYQLLRAGDTQAAIRTFERNCAAFPREWNVFDSLAEAQAGAGDRNGAIANYRRSIELNPYNENGRQMLQKLGATPN